MLVYYEEVNNIESAIQRKKRLKRWKRKWKIELNKKEILNGRISTIV